MYSKNPNLDDHDKDSESNESHVIDKSGSGKCIYDSDLDVESKRVPDNKKTFDSMSHKHVNLNNFEIKNRNNFLGQDFSNNYNNLYAEEQKSYYDQYFQKNENISMDLELNLKLKNHEKLDGNNGVISKDMINFDKFDTSDHIGLNGYSNNLCPKNIHSKQSVQLSNTKKSQIYFNNQNNQSDLYLPLNQSRRCIEFQNKSNLFPNEPNYISSEFDYVSNESASQTSSNIDEIHDENLFFLKNSEFNGNYQESTKLDKNKEMTINSKNDSNSINGHNFQKSDVMDNRPWNIPNSINYPQSNEMNMNKSLELNKFNLVNNSPPKISNQIKLMRSDEKNTRDLSNQNIGYQKNSVHINFSANYKDVQDSNQFKSNDMENKWTSGQHKNSNHNKNDVRIDKLDLNRFQKEETNIFSNDSIISNSKDKYSQIHFMDNCNEILSSKVYENTVGVNHSSSLKDSNHFDNFDEKNSSFYRNSNQNDLSIEELSKNTNTDIRNLYFKKNNMNLGDFFKSDNKSNNGNINLPNFNTKDNGINLEDFYKSSNKSFEKKNLQNFNTKDDNINLEDFFKSSNINFEKKDLRNFNTKVDNINLEDFFKSSNKNFEKKDLRNFNTKVDNINLEDFYKSSNKNFLNKNLQSLKIQKDNNDKEIKFHEKNKYKIEDTKNFTEKNTQFSANNVTNKKSENKNDMKDDLRNLNDKKTADKNFVDKSTCSRNKKIIREKKSRKLNIDKNAQEHPVNTIKDKKLTKKSSTKDSKKESKTIFNEVNYESQKIKLTNSVDTNFNEKELKKDNGILNIKENTNSNFLGFNDIKKKFNSTVMNYKHNIMNTKKIYFKNSADLENLQQFDKFSDDKETILSDTTHKNKFNDFSNSIESCSVFNEKISYNPFDNKVKDLGTCTSDDINKFYDKEIKIKKFNDENNEENSLYVTTNNDINNNTNNEENKLSNMKNRDTELEITGMNGNYNKSTNDDINKSTNMKNRNMGFEITNIHGDYNKNKSFASADEPLITIKEKFTKFNIKETFVKNILKYAQKNERNYCILTEKLINHQGDGFYNDEKEFKEDSLNIPSNQNDFILESNITKNIYNFKCKDRNYSEEDRLLASNKNGVNQIFNGCNTESEKTSSNLESIEINENTTSLSGLPIQASNLKNSNYKRNEVINNEIKCVNNHKIDNFVENKLYKNTKNNFIDNSEPIESFKNEEPFLFQKNKDLENKIKYETNMNGDIDSNCFLSLPENIQDEKSCFYEIIPPQKNQIKMYSNNILENTDLNKYPNDNLKKLKDVNKDVLDINKLYEKNCRNSSNIEINNENENKKDINIIKYSDYRNNNFNIQGSIIDKENNGEYKNVNQENSIDKKYNFELNAIIDTDIISIENNSKKTDENLDFTENNNLKISNEHYNNNRHYDKIEKYFNDGDSKSTYNNDNKNNYFERSFNKNYHTKDLFHNESSSNLYRIETTKDENEVLKNITHNQRNNENKMANESKYSFLKDEIENKNFTGFSKNSNYNDDHFLFQTSIQNVTPKTETLIGIISQLEGNKEITGQIYKTENSFGINIKKEIDKANKSLKSIVNNMDNRNNEKDKEERGFDKGRSNYGSNDNLKQMGDNFGASFNDDVNKEEDYNYSAFFNNSADFGNQKIDKKEHNSYSTFFNNSADFGNQKVDKKEDNNFSTFFNNSADFDNKKVDKKMDNNFSAFFNTDVDFNNKNKNQREENNYIQIFNDNNNFGNEKQEYNYNTFFNDSQKFNSENIFKKEEYNDNGLYDDNYKIFEDNLNKREKINDSVSFNNGYKFDGNDLNTTNLNNNPKSLIDNTKFDRDDINKEEDNNNFMSSNNSSKIDNSNFYESNKGNNTNMDKCDAESVINYDFFVCPTKRMSGDIHNNNKNVNSTENNDVVIGFINSTKNGMNSDTSKINLGNNIETNIKDKFKNDCEGSKKLNNIKNETSNYKVVSNEFNSAKINDNLNITKGDDKEPNYCGNKDSFYNFEYAGFNGDNNTEKNYKNELNIYNNNEFNNSNKKSDNSYNKEFDAIYEKTSNKKHNTFKSSDGNKKLLNNNNNESNIANRKNELYDRNNKESFGNNFNNKLYKNVNDKVLYNNTFNESINTAEKSPLNNNYVLENEFIDEIENEKLMQMKFKNFMITKENMKGSFLNPESLNNNADLVFSEKQGSSINNEIQNNHFAKEQIKNSNDQTVLFFNSNGVLNNQGIHGTEYNNKSSINDKNAGFYSKKINQNNNYGENNVEFGYVYTDSANKIDNVPNYSKNIIHNMNNSTNENRNSATKNVKNRNGTGINALNTIASSLKCENNNMVNRETVNYENPVASITNCEIRDKKNKGSLGINSLNAMASNAQIMNNIVKNTNNRTPTNHSDQNNRKSKDIPVKENNTPSTLNKANTPTYNNQYKNTPNMYHINDQNYKTNGFIPNNVEGMQNSFNKGNINNYINQANNRLHVNIKQTPNSMNLSNNLINQSFKGASNYMNKQGLASYMNSGNVDNNKKIQNYSLEGNEVGNSINNGNTEKIPDSINRKEMSYNYGTNNNPNYMNRNEIVNNINQQKNLGKMNSNPHKINEMGYYNNQDNIKNNNYFKGRDETTNITNKDHNLIKYASENRIFNDNMNQNKIATSKENNPNNFFNPVNQTYRSNLNNISNRIHNTNDISNTVNQAYSVNPYHMQNKIYNHNGVQGSIKQIGLGINNNISNRIHDLTEMSKSVNQNQRWEPNYMMNRIHKHNEMLRSTNQIKSDNPNYMINRIHTPNEISGSVKQTQLGNNYNLQNRIHTPNEISGSVNQIQSGNNNNMVNRTQNYNNLSGSVKQIQSVNPNNMVNRIQNYNNVTGSLKQMQSVNSNDMVNRIQNSNKVPGSVQQIQPDNSNYNLGSANKAFFPNEPNNFVLNKTPTSINRTNNQDNNVFNPYGNNRTNSTCQTDTYVKKSNLYNNKNDTDRNYTYNTIKNQMNKHNNLNNFTSDLRNIPNNIGIAIQNTINRSNIHKNMIKNNFDGSNMNNRNINNFTPLSNIGISNFYDISQSQNSRIFQSQNNPIHFKMNQTPAPIVNDNKNQLNINPEHGKMYQSFNQNFDNSNNQHITNPDNFLINKPNVTGYNINTSNLQPNINLGYPKMNKIPTQGFTRLTNQLSINPEYVNMNKTPNQNNNSRNYLSSVIPEQFQTNKTPTQNNNSRNFQSDVIPEQFQTNKTPTQHNNSGNFQSNVIPEQFQTNKTPTKNNNSRNFQSNVFPEQFQTNKTPTKNNNSRNYLSSVIPEQFQTNKTPTQHNNSGNFQSNVIPEQFQTNKTPTKNNNSRNFQSNVIPEQFQTNKTPTKNNNSRNFQSNVFPEQFQMNKTPIQHTDSRYHDQNLNQKNINAGKTPTKTNNSKNYQSNVTPEQLQMRKTPIQQIDPRYTHQNLNSGYGNMNETLAQSNYRQNNQSDIGSKTLKSTKTSTQSCFKPNNQPSVNYQTIDMINSHAQNNTYQYNKNVLNGNDFVINKTPTQTYNNINQKINVNNENLKMDKNTMQGFDSVNYQALQNHGNQNLYKNAYNYPENNNINMKENKNINQAMVNINVSNKNMKNLTPISYNRFNSSNIGINGLNNNQNNELKYGSIINNDKKSNFETINTNNQESIFNPYDVKNNTNKAYSLNKNTRNNLKEFTENDNRKIEITANKRPFSNDAKKLYSNYENLGASALKKENNIKIVNEVPDNFKFDDINDKYEPKHPKIINEENKNTIGYGDINSALGNRIHYDNMYTEKINNERYEKNQEIFENNHNINNKEECYANKMNKKDGKYYDCTTNANKVEQHYDDSVNISKEKEIYRNVSNLNNKTKQSYDDSYNINKEKEMYRNVLNLNSKTQQSYDHNFTLNRVEELYAKKSNLGIEQKQNIEDYYVNKSNVKNEKNHLHNIDKNNFYEINPEKNVMSENNIKISNANILEKNKNFNINNKNMNTLYTNHIDGTNKIFFRGLSERFTPLNESKTNSDLLEINKKYMKEKENKDVRSGELKNSLCDSERDIKIIDTTTNDINYTDQEKGLVSNNYQSINGIKVNENQGIAKIEGNGILIKEENIDKTTKINGISNSKSYYGNQELNKSTREGFYNVNGKKNVLNEKSYYNSHESKKDVEKGLYNPDVKNNVINEKSYYDKIPVSNIMKTDQNINSNINNNVILNEKSYYGNVILSNKLKTSHKLNFNDKNNVILNERSYYGNIKELNNHERKFNFAENLFIANKKKKEDMENKNKYLDEKENYCCEENKNCVINKIIKLNNIKMLRLSTNDIKMLKIKYSTKKTHFDLIENKINQYSMEQYGFNINNLEKVIGINRENQEIIDEKLNTNKILTDKARNDFEKENKISNEEKIDNNKNLDDDGEIHKKILIKKENIIVDNDMGKVCSKNEDIIEASLHKMEDINESKVSSKICTQKNDTNKLLEDKNAIIVQDSCKNNDDEIKNITPQCKPLEIITLIEKIIEKTETLDKEILNKYMIIRLQENLFEKELYFIDHLQIDNDIENIMKYTNTLKINKVEKTTANISKIIKSSSTLPKLFKSIDRKFEENEKGFCLDLSKNENEKNKSEIYYIYENLHENNERLNLREITMKIILETSEMNENDYVLLDKDNTSVNSLDNEENENEYNSDWQSVTNNTQYFSENDDINSFITFDNCDDKAHK